jgi:hypothetical protein
MSQRRINSQQQNLTQPQSSVPSNEVVRSATTNNNNINNNQILQQQQQPLNKAPNGGGGVVTPELLVDALSGHEDGLLAIAERLMEHYDRGYDVMGEAIIDAFADVQRLFQHAVEAAHMEGAAMEANRQRESTLFQGDDQQQQQQQQLLMMNRTASSLQQSQQHPQHPSVVEEFIDDDVMEVLRDAIQLVTKSQRQAAAVAATTATNTNNNNAPSGSTNTSSLNDAKKQQQLQHSPAWCQIYEKACNSASALLPVDSDHRGRLQLAIARAENLSPDRACAILRYAMEDVLRCCTTNQNVIAPFQALQQQQPSQSQHHSSDNSTANSRQATSGAITVMSSTSTEPTGNGHAVIHHQHQKKNKRGNNHNNNNTTSSSSPPKTRGDCVLEDSQSQQRSEEILDSLLEEMKEILSAPLYENSPIQRVASKFWEVFREDRKLRLRKEEFLEEKLGKLKGEYLLEKAEWEELVNNTAKDVATWRAAYLQLKRHQQQQHPSLGIEQFIGSITYSGGGTPTFAGGDADSDSLMMDDSFYNKGSHSKRISGAASVISQASSSVAHHAKTILSCGSSGGGLQEKNKSVATTATTTTTTATRAFLQP